MPLRRPALPLDGSPRAAAEARRWVHGLCREVGRSDLVECAELGVSELVTNAVLHGGPPISVRVRGTVTHPRIEVLDGSHELPTQPSALSLDLDEEAAFLATFGRGLSIVSMASTAWGATVEEEGKIVWFEPAPDLREDDGADGVFDVAALPEPEPPADDAVDVHLQGLHVPLHTSLERQYSDLRREIRLLALAHEDDYPLARDLSESFARFERQFPSAALVPLMQARRRGQRTVDLVVPMSPTAAAHFETMLEMFEIADAFCRSERLLSLQRTPAQRAFSNWYLGEFVRQLAGEAPVPWQRARARRNENVC